MSEHGEPRLARPGMVEQDGWVFLGCSANVSAETFSIDFGP
jgi:hypothetical protein